MGKERQITENCVSIVLYGVRADANARKNCFDSLCEWFEEVNCLPDKMSIKGKGFGGKPVSFRSATNQLARNGFSGVESFHVFSMLPNGLTPTVDWWATASLSLRRKPYFCIEARASVSGLTDSPIMRLVGECISELRPAYGIGYDRPHSEGPGFYAVGINYVTKDNVTGGPDSEDISKWGQVGMAKEVWNEGILRDIYPQNYLSQPQLTSQVQGQSLAEWISSDVKRGYLSDICEGILLWKIEPHQIDPIRCTLSNAGIIFDWEAYMQDRGD